MQPVTQTEHSHRVACTEQSGRSRPGACASFGSRAWGVTSCGGSLSIARSAGSSALGLMALDGTAFDDAALRAAWIADPAGIAKPDGITKPDGIAKQKNFRVLKVSAT